MYPLVAFCPVVSRHEAPIGEHARQEQYLITHVRAFIPAPRLPESYRPVTPAPTCFCCCSHTQPNPPTLRCSHLAFTDQNRETKMRNVSKRSISLALHTTSLSLGGAAATCRPSASMLGSGPTPADVLSVTESAFSDNRIRSKF